MEIGLSHGDPPGSRVAFSRRIHAGSQYLKINALIGCGLFEPCNEEGHEGLHFILPENLLGRHFFRKPPEGQSLFFTERKSVQDGSEVVGLEMDGMGVGNDVGIPLKGNDNTTILMNDRRGVRESGAPSRHDAQ